jgi:esterase/lipase
MIAKRRSDLNQSQPNHQLILEANAPYELYPEQPLRSNTRLKFGVLLLHGLLDCPFSLKDIGLSLQKQGILCRAILLPGHGTKPDDLLHVTYQDWIHAVQYGIESLRQEVEHLYLIGYSTGAALSLYQGLKNTPLSGIVLLSPAIRINTPITLAAAWHGFLRKINKNSSPWLIKEDEIDYAKYKSIPLNAVNQVAQLTDVIHALREQQSLDPTVLAIISRDDETVSSQSAIRFFSGLENPANRMFLYTSSTQPLSDTRIITRPSRYTHLHIRSFSHTAIPFAPTNVHYGQHGDYRYASHPHSTQYVYGPYNPLETLTYDSLYKYHLAKRTRRELTYNPDFEFMAKTITDFILESISIQEPMAKQHKST